LYTKLYNSKYIEIVNFGIQKLYIKLYDLKYKKKSYIADSKSGI